MERKEIFSIKKLKVGAASVLIGTGIVFLGSEASVALANESVVETTVNRANSDDVGDNSVNLKNSLNNDKMGVNSSTTPQQADTNSIKPTENNSNSSNVYTTNEVSDLENKTNTVDKKDMDIVTNKNSEKISKRSKRSLTDSETIDYSGVKISGKLTNSKTDYAVGEQILGSYNLDVSSPSKIEDGGYILVTASSNEPLDTFEIGTSLRTEKVNDNQYKLYTGELSGGAYVNINVSYKLKKFETGKNSTTTIKAELFDKNNTLIKSTDFSNTNTTGTPYVSVDTRNGIRRQTLLETNQQETEIDVSKSKDLQLSLKSTNKEAAAITKIDHAVELPAGVTIAQTSLDAGWRLENGVAKYTRVVPSSTTIFASGDNTQNELLHLNVSNGGTPAEFLTGKKLTFKDSATYTDKSGFTNTTSDDVTVTVHALNPKKSIDGSDPGTVVGPVPTKSNVQVDIANITMEGDKSRVVNIAMPYVKTTTEDTRNIKLLGAYKGANGPASVKEVEISIDSNIDQNRAIEFYAIWTPTDEGKSTFVSYQNNPESLGLKSTLTFEVYSVANGTEKKIGEVSLRKGDAADKVALPDGITTIRLRPKGNMPLEASGLRQVGLFLSQDLKGLEEAKKIAKEGKKVESIVTSSVYTYGYDEPKVDVSKTTFANSREAIKLAPTTNPITATLAGNKTQELSSQYEVYEYSPNGLGNRIYNKQIFDRKTYVNLQDINAKNAKLLVELPDGFSYAGDDDSVKTVENYNNSGKTVLEVTPKNQNSEYTLSPNLQFKVDKWVESGKYPVKYTLVWDEDERVVGINPNNDYDGTNTTITNTSSFTYELPVINNSATRLMTQVTDQTTDSSTYSTGAYNLAPNDKVKYRLSLTNSSNAATRNNVVISTLPRVSDKNIVLNSKDRGSQFDVHMTAAATTPEGWTAYYSTTPVSGTAVDLEKTITLTADQVTDWSTVTAVKFVSNQDVALKAGSTAAFYIPAKASSTATNNQIAVLSSATRTDGQDTFNETNPARISIKIEDVKKGAVKVAYENKDNVPIKDNVTAIESRAYKKGYDVDTKEYKPDTLIGKDGKEYYFVKVKDSSPKPTGTIDSPEVTVTYVYDLLYEEITKATKQTVTYEGAGKKTPAPNEQKDYIFTKKTNKVTNVTTWNEETHTYEFVTTPKVEGYYADKAQAGGKEVTPTNPEASDKVVYKPLGKVILVDEGGNEIPNTPKPTYKNNPNDPTLGGETPIPEIPDGYEIKPKQDVPGFNSEGKVVTPQKPGEDTRIVLVAKQGDITKATKQTVTYEGAGENTPAPNEQTNYTFTGKTNKVTNVTTWNEETHTYGVVTTPKVEGYYADKAQAGGKEVTPTNPEASDKVVYKPLGKVILVDEGGNEIPNTPKPTYKNNPNDPTLGGETPIPEIPDGYEIKPKQDVPGFNSEGKVVTPQKPGEDTRIVLVAKQGDITKATKQTVTYEGAGENTPAPNEQTNYTFTGKTNKVTNVTTWNEETHTYGVVTTPKVEGYYADKAQAGGKEVTPTNPEASDKVVYKPLGKVILVDEGGNEIPNTPKPTYKNNPNDPTLGGETPIPEIPDGYEIKPKQDVPGFNSEGKVVTPQKPGEDTRIVLVAKQGDITKATKQTVTYEGAGENTPAPNEQTNYTFTGKTNKVTNVTTWNEETHTYGVVTTPKVEGYYADKAQAGGKEVTPTNPEASDKVVYKPLGKVILVDEGGNEIPNTPKPTYKNNPNDPTLGGETPIPEIPDGYEIKPKQDVPGFNSEGKVVTPQKPGEDTRIVLVAKTVPVTPTTPQNPNEDPQNPQPGDPIDSKNPNGPKWTKEALDKLNNIKSVTRTITYIKDGTTEEVSPTEAPKWTDKVSFTRTVVVNPKDGSVVGYDTTGDGIADVAATDTTSGWKATGTAKFAEKTSPVVKGYVVKPNQDTQGDLVEADGSKVKASTTDLTVDSPNQDLKVRYVPVGTWTPKVPEGETPIDPIPYPNDPTDPGKVVDPNKPTDPNGPNKPSGPVIPHIPGTTPKDPEGNPLKPVDPQDPSKGYVPPTPKIPTENTEIKYEKDTQKDTQKATVKYVVEGTNTVLHTDELEGKSGEAINYSTADKLADLRKLGYELVTDGFTTEPDKNFDKDTKVDQNFDVIVKPKVVDVPPFDSTNPNDPNTPKPGQPIDPENPTGPKWTEELIKSLETTKHVNRTISYVKEDGNKVEYTDKAGNKSTADVTDKVTFTRPAKINLVIGKIEHGNWTAVNGDNKFDAVLSPVVKGYVLKDSAQKEVAATENLTENSKDENIKVVYVPVGKLVPKVPEGVTPPTPVTDTPYENVPGEPGKVVPPSSTKPIDPQDPNSPKVPVIPHIPGTTPQVPKDPTKPVDPNTNPLVPLEPVTPGKPEEGYKVPPVPTDPTKNLEINYEKDTQKAVTKFVNPSGNLIPGVNNIEETGKSGEPLTKATEVTTEITKLIAKGYDLVSNNYGKDNNGNFDKDSGKDQEYTVVLTPHVQDVPPFDPTNPNDQNTPKPGQPINPNNPDGPKWTEELIKSLETTKHVNRTISYVKEDGSKVEYTDKDGNKSTAEVTDKVTFTRPAKINVVTGTIEYGKWTPVNNDTTFDKVTSPVVPGYVLKDAAQKEIAETTGLTENSKDETIKVVYVPVGKLVPKVPEGVTPPTPVTDTPYENVPGEPGKVVPPSSTKPIDPQDPNSPKVPVIPHIPGTTPQVPKDPTKPVDPNTNPLVPLEPVTPGKPEEGYKVPPVPTDPTKNLEINYEKDTQKATVKYVVEGTNTVLHTDKLEGKSGEPINYSTATKLAELKALGYELVNDGFTTAPDKNFDKDTNVDQNFDVIVKPKVVDVPPFDSTNPNDPNTPKPGQPIDPENPTGPKWTEELIKSLETTKHVNRTISYVKEDGNKVEYTDKAGNKSTADVTDKVTFTRPAKINLVIGKIEHGNWTAVNGDNKFDAVLSPVVKGYVLKDSAQKEVAATENLTENSKDENIKVVYVPVGTWTPKVPEGETPIDPIPYPNDPTDPGKVVDPNKPTDPNGPNKPSGPVIPHIPGTTPKDPEGNPLKPVDPQDPSKGYVPPTPKIPTENTEIKYEKDTQKATVKYVVEGTNTVLHTDELEGKSGEAINYSTADKLADLRKLGYELVTDGFTTAPDKNFDKDTKVDQNFVVTVKPKVVDVPPFDPTNPNDQNTPKPGQPINPNNPDGPKWTEELIKSLETTKHVNRTISYVKEDGSKVEYTDKDGNKSTADVTDKVTFTRKAKVNVVTGTIEYGKWTPVNNDTTFDKVTSPVVKGYVLKDSAQKEVAATENLTENSKDENIKVVYVPVGKLVPKVPEGVTPPTPVTDTPYENVPGEPGKVVPPSSTKPIDPQDPNSPKVPVIPHIPGTTPQVPKDPTKPVDPNTNPLVPLEPVTPGKPEEGYKVPPVPTDPTKNLEINYEKDTQKAVTKFVNPSGNLIPGVNNIEETGKSGEPLTKATEVTTEITKLIAKGYDLVSNNYGKDNNGNFDKDSGKDQEYTVVLTTHIQDVPPFDSTNPNDPNTPQPGQPIDPENPTGPKWTEELIKSLENTKHVNRTISYVKEDGNKVEYTDKDGNKSTADVTDKVTFTRPAKINVVTGTIEYGKWTPVNNDTTFDKVTSPVVPGYVLKDAAQKEIAETTGLTENSKDETIKVVYVPVGKLVPKVPEGVTPPTPVTDTPYENVPGEPGKVVPPSSTKPIDPQDPNSPKVPVIPHIPGTTPQVPKDPTKPVDPNTNPLVPLKPIDPQDPSKGYEVPPVPTDSTTNTPVNYVKDGQKAITNFVDNNGKVVSDPVVDQGDSGSKFTKSGEVESKIKELAKKGYVVTSNEYPSDDKDRVFDNDKDKDQIFNVKVTPLIVPTDPNSPDKPMVPTDPTKPVGPNNPLRPVTPSTPEPGKPVFPEDPNSPVWPETVKDMVTESSAPRTITYVDQNGKEVAATHTETIKFKRSAKVNLVTGEITYGEWSVVGDDTILDGNKLPKVDGYIARGGDIKESQEDIKATVGTNITQTVVYDKLGSWVPKVPENATPVPPITYPNDPTDPTKPGTDKPRVPHVPGFIPVGPDGTPLKTVDPKDPSKGYEVPDVPTDPTKDTPISYVPVTPEKPTPERINPKPTPVVPVQPEGPVTPATPKAPAKAGRLANTGTTETNTGLAGLGLGILGVLLAAARRRKEKNKN